MTACHYCHQTFRPHELSEATLFCSEVCERRDLEEAKAAHSAKVREFVQWHGEQDKDLDGEVDPEN